MSEYPANPGRGSKNPRPFSAFAFTSPAAKCYTNHTHNLNYIRKKGKTYESGNH
ncbi:hypothetical protein CLOSTASPAR_06479 [[Clostridium] asparagiforme DSM 15981]|uniref:Uncharacterized protein n=1 Tax=[Clostridium] asparagiforme DSM 15981 TaxID=518636 RepID=C0DB24_9FIRM|nr:hypothetical protein CLOSTASPAR_06479 [[Clostridium] asparagiforme DSM 15981]